MSGPHAPIRFLTILFLLLTSSSLIYEDARAFSIAGKDSSYLKNYPIFDTNKASDQNTVGDLYFSMPISAVPGGPQGHDLKINVEYRSGIKMEDEASLIGLGFTLSLGTIVEFDTGTLALYFEGASHRINKISDGKYELPDYPGWALSASKTYSQDEGETIQYFTLISPDGTQYFFGSVAGEMDSPSWNGRYSTYVMEDRYDPNSNEPFCKKRPCNQYRRYTWELSEIHGTGYSDTNKDRTADTGDAGQWIRIRYKDYTSYDECHQSNFGGCPYYFPPFQNWDGAVFAKSKGKDLQARYWKKPPQALANQSNWTYQDGAYISRMMAIPAYHIYEIETPGYLSRFVVQDRKDFRSNRMTESRAKRLERIELVEKTGYRNISDILHKVEFSYDESYPLCVGAPYTEAGMGKLTLKKITIYTKGRVTDSINFEYADNAPPGKGANPLYSQYAVDWWGYPNGAEDNTSYSDGNHEPNDFSKSWSLTGVKHLDGKEELFAYDTHDFSYRNNPQFFKPSDR